VLVQPTPKNFETGSLMLIKGFLLNASKRLRLEFLTHWLNLLLQNGH
jgi:hypothetical protein